MTRQAQAERQEAIDKLRDWIKPGDTVYTILDNVSRSGMSRAIRVVLLDCHDGKPTDTHPNWAVGKALGLRHWKRNSREQDALTVGGCGMDMGFHLVYELSHTLYGAELHSDVYLDSATHDQPGGRLLTREGAPAGKVYVGGYACLGKGKCPSNYHSNHRDRVRCPGIEDRFCWRPDPFSSRFPAPEDWPRSEPIDIGDGQTIAGHLLACLTSDDDKAREVCPTCKGEGDLPNPDGPERFDLVHLDGYALRHRWL